MGVELIVHRGYNNTYDNSLMGILVAVARGRFCEVDISFIRDEWVLCHDRQSYTRSSCSLVELLEILKTHEQLWVNTLLLDIKWDYVINPSQCDKAMSQLWQILEGMENNQIWLQAGCDEVLDHLIEWRDHHNATKWHYGKIMRSMSELPRLVDNMIDFATMNIEMFAKEELAYVKNLLTVIAYTCPNINDTRLFTNYEDVIDGLVCDMSIEDERKRVTWAI